MTWNEKHKLNTKINNMANFYVKYLWGEQLNIPVKVNYRYRQILGMYMTNKYIHVSREVMDDENAIADTLLHELCHWYCHQTGLQYSDEDEDFIKETEYVGCTLSGYTTFLNGEYVSYPDLSSTCKAIPFMPSTKMIAIIEAYKKAIDDN